MAPYRTSVIWAVGTLAVVVAGLLLIKVAPPIIGSLGTYLTRPFSTISILKNPLGSLRSSSGRTNILILGRGGAAHEAPDLTDTMILVSIRHSDQRISLISIPRDIWIDSMKAKINTAYYFGEQKEPGSGGFILTRDAVFQVTDLPVHYVALIDFEGFKRAVDLVGGIEVEVKRSFTDEKYPVEDANGEKPSGAEPVYETVRFEGGVQRMDGSTALKFARSRNSTDAAEGTDFARSQRQQQILLALVKKVKQKETLFNPERVAQLRSIFNEYTKTDIGDREVLALGRIGLNADLQDIRHVTLDVGVNEPDGLLVNPPVSKYGQWVLESRVKDWADVHAYVVDQLSQ